MGSADLGNLGNLQHLRVRAAGCTSTRECTSQLCQPEFLGLLEFSELLFHEACLDSQLEFPVFRCFFFSPALRFLNALDPCFFNGLLIFLLSRHLSRLHDRSEFREVMVRAIGVP